MKIYKKISIIGGSGCGKTVLSENLGDVYGLPVYHLDGFNYNANWVQVDEEVRDSNIRTVIAQDEWIVEGTYKSTLQERCNVSDLVIYLDYSTFSQVVGVMKRFIKNGGKEKKEVPGCNEKMDWKFLKFVITYRKKKRENIVRVVSNTNKNVEILIFKNRRQLNKWFKKEFNKKIEI